MPLLALVLASMDPAVHAAGEGAGIVPVRLDFKTRGCDEPRWSKIRRRSPWLASGRWGLTTHRRSALGTHRRAGAGRGGQGALAWWAVRRLRRRGWRAGPGPRLRWPTAGAAHQHPPHALQLRRHAALVRLPALFAARGGAALAVGWVRVPPL